MCPLAWKHENPELSLTPLTEFYAKRYLHVLSESVVLTTGAAVVVTLRAANKKNELSTETILHFKYLPNNILKMKNSFNSLKLSMIKKNHN